MQHVIDNNQGRTLLVYAQTAQNRLDRAMVDRLQRERIAMLLRPAVVGTQVRYDVSGLVTLAAHLRTIGTVAALARVLAQLKELLDTCVERHLPLKGLDLSYDTVFVGGQTDTLSFVYLPFEGLLPDVGGIRGFMEGIPAQVGATDASVREMLASYQGFFTRSTLFNPVDFATYLGSLSAGARDTPTRVVSAAGTLTEVHERPASAVAAQAGEEDGTTRMLQADAAPTRSESAEVTSAASTRARGAHMRVDPGTTVLGALSFDYGIADTPPADAELPDEGTTVLDDLPATAPTPPVEVPAPVPPTPSPHSDELRERSAATAPAANVAPVQAVAPVAQTPTQTPVRHYWLRRRSTGERVRVVGERFVVGKSKYSTYQVRNTNTVSRSHAIFICDDEGCWIEDDHSRNFTYVDNRRLEPHKRERLEDGMVIRMSDEEFEFIVTDDEGR